VTMDTENALTLLQAAIKANDGREASRIVAELQETDPIAAAMILTEGIEAGLRRMGVL
jgi:hypothetical protein